MSLWSMFENRQIAAIEEKCRRFRNSSDYQNTHCAANNWPILTQNVAKEAYRFWLQTSLKVFFKNILLCMNGYVWSKVDSCFCEALYFDYIAEAILYCNFLFLIHSKWIKTVEVWKAITTHALRPIHNVVVSMVADVFSTVKLNISSLFIIISNYILYRH